LNGAMALLRYFTEFTYNVVLKQLLGLHPFQNLLLIVYDQIAAFRRKRTLNKANCLPPSRALNAQ